jgi:hypothetical protein
MSRELLGDHFALTKLSFPNEPLLGLAHLIPDRAWRTASVSLDFDVVNGGTDVRDRPFVEGMAFPNHHPL